MGWGDPAVAAAVDGFDEDRIVGGISQGIAEALDGAADGEIEIDIDIIGPERLTEFLAGDDFVGTAEQKLQGSEGQVLDSDLDTVLAQFIGAKVGFEHTEQDNRRRAIQRVNWHRNGVVWGESASLPSKPILAEAKFLVRPGVRELWTDSFFQTTTPRNLLHTRDLAGHILCTNGSRREH
ncbi:MAG: hypothetical protein WBW53_04415 [Terriglobales bacterium]